MTREQQLTEAFVDLSDTLADDADPLMLLDRLARYCVDLTSIDAAGVMLVNARGQLRPAVATDDRTTLTEIMQVQIRQGPCVDAYDTGVQVHAVELRDHAEQWPAFVPLALAAGYDSAHALPLHVRGQTVGVLNLFSVHRSALTGTETRLLRALTDVATTAVLTWDRALLRPGDIAPRVQVALSGEALIDTACGMLAATVGISPYQAARQLFIHAARIRLRPTDVADQLVRRVITPQYVLGAVPDKSE
ncbi:GAF and ANTAR domain-containing protein [Streptomyces sp. NPDC005141]